MVRGANHLGPSGKQQVDLDSIREMGCVMTGLRSVVSIFLIVLLVTVTGAPATAQGIGPVADRESHCVVAVMEETTQGELITGAPTCFGDFAEAIGFASGGSLQLGRGTTGDVVFADDTIAARVSEFTLGIHYADKNGRGSSVTVVGGSCSGGYWNAPSWLANKISSSYHGCGVLTHHDLPDLSGAAYTTSGRGTTQNLPGFNNRVESVRYLP